jgi:predicted  nucleic acid-binding Zn-ribbon protein
MTDADDPAASVTIEPAGDAPVQHSVASQLLALQHIDTEADQLRVRRERLPERDDLAVRTDQLNAWEQRRTQLNDRLAELDTAIESAEKRNAELGADRDRLEAQLRTVIAPREAEALMHEIETVNAQRNDLDDAELAALEEQSTLDDERTEHLAQEESLRSALRSADEAFGRACQDIDVELEALAERRESAVSALSDGIVARYMSVRGSAGVAVAELKGHRCEGCHIDLSAAEVDTAKEDAADTGFTDCPSCGRLLVI